MTFRIMNSSGTYVDMLPFIAAGGLKWSRSDTSGGNKSTMQNGETWRDRIATKCQWEITCKPLKAADLKTVLQLIAPEYVTVNFTDPNLNARRTASLYSDSCPSTFLIRRADGTEYWGGVQFTLIEK